MPQAYVPIQTVTVGAGGAASIEFTNIPQNYTDLVLKFSVRMSNSVNVVDDVTIALNGATTSFSMRRLFGVGSGTPASDIGGGNYNWVAQAPNAGATASIFSNSEIYIPNYAGSTNKSISADSVSENNGTVAYAFLGALLRSNTAAITSITLGGFASNFVQHSTATLYGVGGARASGGTITADGYYTYHTFTSSGTFQPLERIRGAEVLVIGGGGGGGRAGGGGGAGSIVYNTITSIVPGFYSITIGSGGAGSTSRSNQGGDGVASTAFGISATGGGGAGSYNSVNGRTGGSGGGSGNAGTGGGTSAGTLNGGIGYVNNGGSGTGTGVDFGAGGGGAGAVGGNPAPGIGGIGGNGLSTWSSWGLATSTGQNVSGTVWFAGGGTGFDGVAVRAGGNGGGGSSSLGSANGGDGTANTGGGGGGSRDSGGGNGGAGGSGLVIVRYPN